MVHTEYIGARMRYRAEQRARRRKHALTIMRNVCGVAAFVFFMLVFGKAGASDCGAAWGEYFAKLGKRYGLTEEFRENGII